MVGTGYVAGGARRDKVCASRHRRERLSPRPGGFSARGGSAESFAQLYDLSRSRLLQIILRINGDAAEAEELLQDIFFEAWTRSEQFDDRRGQVAQWLAGMAKHAALDSLRQRKTRPHPQWRGPMAGDEDCYSGLATRAEGLYDIAARRSVSRVVERSLDRLPRTHRQVLRLAFYDGLTLPEIAERTGRPLAR